MIPASDCHKVLPLDSILNQRKLSVIKPGFFMTNFNSVLQSVSTSPNLPLLLKLFDQNVCSHSSMYAIVWVLRHKTIKELIIGTAYC
jgi:hypothetical protein